MHVKPKSNVNFSGVSGSSKRRKQCFNIKNVRMPILYSRFPKHTDLRFIDHKTGIFSMVNERPFIASSSSSLVHYYEGNYSKNNLLLISCKLFRCAVNI